MSLINNIVVGDCSEVLRQINDESIDMCITSPPYDNLRVYKGYKFPFERIVDELFRVLKKVGS